MSDIRREIKLLVRGLVMNSVNHGDNVLSADEVDMLLTMNQEEAEFFNDRIKFGSCNVMHVDDFVTDETTDIAGQDITTGSGLIGTKPRFNTDSVFVQVGKVFSNHYEPRRGGPIFHYVKVHGDIREIKHYEL